MKRHAIIRTPFPTTEEVARELGVPLRRVRELQKLVDEVVSMRKVDSTSAAFRSKKIKAGS